METRTNDDILRPDEKVICSLRDLYGSYGYLPFRTGRFEDYELYARNKDFLGSYGILTFTGAGGRLMALKPDVTLSIARSTEPRRGSVQKFYYNDEVFRMNTRNGSLREVPQTGVECIGDLGKYDISEVLTLAVMSLKMISGECMMDISHMGIVQGLTRMLDLPDQEESLVLHYIGEKNVHGVREICRRNDVPEELTDKVAALIRTYGPMEEVLGKIGVIASGPEMENAVEELSMIDRILRSAGLADSVRFDFSVVNDMGYYNGIIFQGFVNGAAGEVLSGGRYDNLMKKMGKDAGAIGFSIDTSFIRNITGGDAGYDVDVVLMPGDNESPETVAGIVRDYTDRGLRVTVQRTKPEKLTYRELAAVTDGEVKPVE